MKTIIESYETRVSQILNADIVKLSQQDLSQAELDASITFLNNHVHLITKYSRLFYCYDLTNLNYSSLNTSLATDMSHMFDSCVSSSYLDLHFRITDNVQSMNSMFQHSNPYCVNLSSFNTSKVTCMENMFNGLVIKSGILDLSSFDTSNVTNMHWMFSFLKINQLILSRIFSTSRVNEFS